MLAIFQLLILFILVQLAILARYLVFDAFEPWAYASTFLFPIASVFLYFVSKNFKKKEENYAPTNITGWSYYPKQRIFLNEKPLYKNDKKRGFIQRYFLNKWQYLIADFISFNFYLSLKIEIDHITYLIIEEKPKLFSAQSYFIIYKNGTKIGTAKTVVNLKNSTKLKEVLQFTIQDETFETSASTITSGITLNKDNSKVGTLTRNHLISNVLVIDLQEERHEYLIALILHSFYFKNS